MSTSQMNFLRLPVLLGLLGAVAQAQAPPAKAQSDLFNSTLNLHAHDISLGALDKKSAKAVEVAVNFERSNWAAGAVSGQSIYTIPASAAKLKPGSVIATEENTDTTTYTVPPEVAMSRFTFQSENLNGTRVPASAYVLWPYMPKKFDGINGVPLVAFAHGNSGWNAECAPSHYRNLYYHFSAPFELALQGYAVVAPDYAGLGVEKDAHGKKIFAQWMAHPAAANDLMYSVQAARKAFPELSEEFVVMGHSQGGGAAWAAAQRQANKPVEGYLGTIAGSPATSVHSFTKVNPYAGAVFAPALARYFKDIFPSFKKTDFVNKLGLDRLSLLSNLDGCASVVREMFDTKLFTDDWITIGGYIKKFDEMTSNGGKPFQGPMLVLQGDADTTVAESSTTEAVHKTCKGHAKRSLRYVRFPGVDHVPVLYSSRAMWLDWIADRFKGRHVPGGCSQETVQPLRAVQNYQKEIPFFLEYALYSYEVS